MKQWISMALTALICIGIFSGCSSGETVHDSSSGQKLRIVATIFPAYDWVREILGEDAEHAELTLLLDSGVDLHSYQPTAEDILKISTCDLFLCVGGESDQWVSDALRESTNPEQQVIQLLDVLGDAAKPEELLEGMEEEHEHEEEEETEYDEHVWLSLKNAAVFCRKIADTLSEIDPAHASSYQENTAVYCEKLAQLDTDYQEATDNARQTALVFCDRFPFRYLADDYGLTCYAAFPGCSAETEASFETVAFLAKKIDEQNLSCVLTLEKSDQKLAFAVLQNTDVSNKRILTLDSMQSTTAEQAQGEHYLAVMESNLEILKQALQ